MAYRARRYVSFPGRTYMPGERIDDALTDAQKERLERLGAIERINGGRADDAEESCEEIAEETETAEETEEAEEEEEEETVSAPITIDVMDGIRPKRGRRKAGN